MNCNLSSQKESNLPEGRDTKQYKSAFSRILVNNFYILIHYHHRVMALLSELSSFVCNNMSRPN